MASFTDVAKFNFPIEAALIGGHGSGAKLGDWDVEQMRGWEYREYTNTSIEDFI